MAALNWIFPYSRQTDIGFCLIQFRDSLLKTSDAGGGHFYRLSRVIGLRGQSASHGPRLHDFRHRFAVETLLNWYHRGEDVERRLPILSTYLGHAHVTDTYWYLSACPELMSLATLRLEKRWEGWS